MSLKAWFRYGSSVPETDRVYMHLLDAKEMNFLLKAKSIDSLRVLKEDRK